MRCPVTAVGTGEETGCRAGRRIENDDPSCGVEEVEARDAWFPVLRAEPVTGKAPRYVPVANSPGGDSPTGSWKPPVERVPADLYVTDGYI